VPSRKEKVAAIAKKYKVSPAQIMAINGFRKGIVRAGFPVIVPSEKVISLFLLVSNRLL